MFDFKQLQKLQQEMQEKIKKMQEELANKTVEASSGGGMVTVVANGKQEIMSVKINKEAIDPDDVEMLEDLVIAAVNGALEKSRALSEEGMNKITGGFKIPGLNL